MVIKSLMGKKEKKETKPPFLASRDWKLHAVVHMVYARLQP